MADYDQTDSEADNEQDRSAAKWLDMLAEAKRCDQKYHDKCDNIDKLYADLDALAKETSERQFQIFWANLEVLKPSIYSRPPVPVVVPRFKDRKELPRKASEMLERCLVSSFEADDIDATMRLARDDLATNARGVIWLRLEQRQNEDGSVFEKVHKEHLERKDFRHGKARKWSEVPWVARRSWVTRKKGLARFGDIFLKAELKSKRDGDDDGYSSKEAEVWELWDKDSRTVVWVSPGMEDVLDIQPAFLDLEGFFPCPRPAFGTIKRGTLTPVPDFLYYKDQVEEINELTARISSLAESLKLKGFYPGGASDVGDAIETVLKDQSNTATLVPISNLAAFGSGAGGLKDSIVWLPVREVAEVIQTLVELRRQLIEDVYQITGISDIMRGQTDPNETKGAQDLKSQYGSIRIRDKQNELVRLARDVTRMEAEIMAEHFQPQSLMDMSQIDVPTDQQIAEQIGQITQQVQMAAADPRVQQMAQENPEQAKQMLEQAQAQVENLQAQVTLEKIVALLREQRMRPFILEIETDSTIQPDENAAKQRASEFITSVGGYMQQAVTSVQMVPEMAPLAAEMLKYVASQFRVGRSVDGAIDEFADKMKEAAGQPKPPSPEQIKAEADAKAKEAEMQSKAADMQAKQQEGQLKLEEMKLAAEAKAQEYNMKLEELRQKGANDAQMAEIQRETATVNLELKRLDVLIKKADLASKGMKESEDGEDVVDKSDDQTTSIVQAVSGQSEALAEVLGRFTMAIEAMAAQQSRPKSITTPDGRTYTASVN